MLDLARLTAEPLAALVSKGTTPVLLVDEAQELSPAGQVHQSAALASEAGDLVLPATSWDSGVKRLRARPRFAHPSRLILPAGWGKRMMIGASLPCALTGKIPAKNRILWRKSGGLLLSFSLTRIHTFSASCAWATHPRSMHGLAWKCHPPVESPSIGLISGRDG